MQKNHRMALLKACHIMGGQKQLAKGIKVNVSRLNKWINRNKGPIPLRYALAIENATSGQVTCDELISSWWKIVEHCKRKKSKNER
jgi:DNA-binding transcriptional regulator YdaS (Cro superfamily)